MSHPNSIFSATREEAIAYASGKGGEVHGLFEFGGLTDLDLSNLFSIVVDEDFDFDRHELLPLAEETPFDLVELPMRFVEALAEKGEADIPDVAIRWSQTEELHCDPEDLMPIIRSLMALSKTADDKSVYFSQ